MVITFDDFANIMEAISEITGVDDTKAMELFEVIADILELEALPFDEDEAFLEAMDESDLEMEDIVND